MYGIERERDREATADRRPEPEARTAPVLDARHIMRLQATAGNQAVQRLLAARPAPGRTLLRLTTGRDLEADKAHARSVIDPLLTQYFVGQDLASVDDEREKRKRETIRKAIAGMDVMAEKFLETLDAATAKAEAEFAAEEHIYAPLKAAYQEGDRISRGLDLLAEGMFRTKDFVRKLEYWRAKAARVRNEKRNKIEGRLPLWCDHATALVIDRLAGDPAFKSSLDVIKQGDPHVSGHWYVLANREGDIAYGRKLTENEFVIDLWGALRRSLPTTVLDRDSAYADYSGVLNLFPIEKLESVMTLEEGRPRGSDEPSAADLIADAVLAGEGISDAAPATELVEHALRAGDGNAPSAAELIADALLAGEALEQAPVVEGDEDFNALLSAFMSGEQATQAKGADELLQDAPSAGEGIEDLDALLGRLDAEKHTRPTDPTPAPAAAGSSGDI